MRSDIAERGCTDVADDRPSFVRFAVCGRGRFEVWEVAFGRCGVVVCRAVFERCVWSAKP